MLTAEFISKLFQLIGFIVGLGAVTVIDWHGFMGQKSVYWTKATVSAHKITKPLIWTGTILLLVGKIIKLNLVGLTDLMFVEFLLMFLLILNGCFLSFYVSPYLLKLEKKGITKPLPSSLQSKIKISFIFSLLGWWSLVFLFILYK